MLVSNGMVNAGPLWRNSSASWTAANIDLKGSRRVHDLAGGDLAAVKRTSRRWRPARRAISG